MRPGKQLRMDQMLVGDPEKLLSAAWPDHRCCKYLGVNGQHMEESVPLVFSLFQISFVRRGCFKMILLEKLKQNCIQKTISNNQ